MNDQMLEFHIEGIAMEDASETPRVILHNTDVDGILTITVGPFEASAIIVELEGIHPPRPLTHDLLAQLFRKHRFQLDCVEIYDWREDRYLSRLRYRDGAQSHAMEVRPSDAIALAARLDAPIFAPRALIGRRSGNHPYAQAEHPRPGEHLYCRPAPGKRTCN